MPVVPAGTTVDPALLLECFERREEKYLLTPEAAEELLDALSPRIHPDLYGL